MFEWLRKTFGQCKNRWHHDWKVSKNGVETDVGDTRICTVCGLRQSCVGHYGFMDSDTIPQWDAGCSHEYMDDGTVGATPNTIVCARNNLDKHFAYRICKKCNRVEVYESGAWTDAGAYLVLSWEQWLELKQSPLGVADWQPSYKERGLTGKYRSIDD